MLGTPRPTKNMLEASLATISHVKLARPCCALKNRHAFPHTLPKPTKPELQIILGEGNPVHWQHLNYSWKKATVFAMAAFGHVETSAKAELVSPRFHCATPSTNFPQLEVRVLQCSAFLRFGVRQACIHHSSCHMPHGTTCMEDVLNMCL